VRERELDGRVRLDGGTAERNEGRAEAVGLALLLAQDEPRLREGAEDRVQRRLVQVGGARDLRQREAIVRT
jgi:hypothetical protein